MEIKTTHEIWSAHFHNDAFPEEDISCKKKWVAVEDVIKLVMKFNPLDLKKELLNSLSNENENKN